MNDEVAELADRLRAKLRRGEKLGLEFETDFASLTEAERDDFMALVEQQAAHGEERLESLRENTRILLALHDLVESSKAPLGTTLGQALVAGYISVLEVVEAMGAVPDPLAQQGHRRRQWKRTRGGGSADEPSGPC